MKSTMEISLTNKSLTISIGGTFMNKLIQWARDYNLVYGDNKIILALNWYLILRWTASIRKSYEPISKTYNLWEAYQNE